MESGLGSASLNQQIDPPPTFGVRKVLDWKIIEGGRHMYKVEWHATWEPAEALATCQHLVDEFWAFVNKSKANEQVGTADQQQQEGSSMPLTLTSPDGSSDADANFRRICENNKADVNRLIQRTLMVSPESSVHSTNDMFQYSDDSSPLSIKRKREEPSRNAVNPNTVIFEMKPYVKTEYKIPSIKTENGYIVEKPTSGDGLRYIENFMSPYVDLKVVCKVCGKEQSLQHSRYWREHFKTHNKEQAHKCEHCPKTFIKPCHLRRHIKAKHTNTDGSIRKGPQFVIAQESATPVSDNLDTVVSTANETIQMTGEPTPVATTIYSS